MDALFLVHVSDAFDMSSVSCRTACSLDSEIMPLYYVDFVVVPSY